MTHVTSIVGFDSVLRDRYPAPGERYKQYVIDERQQDAWEQETCPKLTVPPHYEDPGDDAAPDDPVIVGCASVGETSWLNIQGRDSRCRFCEGFAFAARGLPVMVDWFAARDRHLAEHPICADRSQLSDETAPMIDLRLNPLFAFLRGRP